MTMHKAELRPVSVDMYIMCLEYIPLPHYSLSHSHPSSFSYPVLLCAHDPVSLVTVLQRARMGHYSQECGQITCGNTKEDVPCLVLVLTHVWPLGSRGAWVQSLVCFQHSHESRTNGSMYKDHHGWLSVVRCSRNIRDVLSLELTENTELRSHQLQLEAFAFMLCVKLFAQGCLKSRGHLGCTLFKGNI